MHVDDELLFRVLIGSANLAEHTRVRAWREKAPENEQHYQEIAAILYLASLADRSMLPAEAPTVGAVLSGSTRKPSAHEAVPPSVNELGFYRRMIKRWKLVTPIAAAVVAVLVGTTIDLGGPAEASTEVHEFVTGPNETANVVLGDGTVIRLGSNSRLRVPSNTTDREVSISGRAYFAVAKDEDRPFTVKTPDGAVRVLGTRFAVEAVGDDLELVVIEGRVSLNASREEIELEAKQLARVVGQNSLPVVTVQDPAAVADWVGNFLAFQDTPLKDVISEISRKYDVKIVLADPALGERTITAWFADYPMEEVMKVVCIVANTECTTSDAVITMRPQR